MSTIVLFCSINRKVKKIMPRSFVSGFWKDILNFVKNMSLKFLLKTSINCELNCVVEHHFFYKICSPLCFLQEVYGAVILTNEHLIACKTGVLSLANKEIIDYERNN